MRQLTLAECAVAAGGFEDQATVVDDVVVTGRRSANEFVGFFKDFFGWDSGSFQLGDIGIGSLGGGHVVIQGGVAAGGAAIALPTDEEGEVLFGNVLEADFDPTDGSLNPAGPSVEFVPGGVDPGLTVNWNGVEFWVPISPGGGIGLYPVPGGEHGEYYWGYPPGGELGPNP